MCVDRIPTWGGIVQVARGVLDGFAQLAQVTIVAQLDGFAQLARL